MKKILIITIVIILVGGFFVKVENDLDLNSKEDKINLIKYTVKWMGKVATNVYDVTTYAISKDWSPEE